jgi:hypothetical protein
MHKQRYERLKREAAEIEASGRFNAPRRVEEEPAFAQPKSRNTKQC